MSKQTCEGCDQISTSVDEGRQKRSSSSKQEVLKLLTLLPKKLDSSQDSGWIWSL
jgi:hypothetical protein